MEDAATAITTPADIFDTAENVRSCSGLIPRCCSPRKRRNRCVSSARTRESFAGDLCELKWAKRRVKPLTPPDNERPSETVALTENCRRVEPAA